MYIDRKGGMAYSSGLCDNDMCSGKWTVIDHCCKLLGRHLGMGLGK